MNGKRFSKLGTRGRHSRASKVVLAGYRYEGDKAIATHMQDEGPILRANYEERQSQDVHHRIADLDMGLKFASIPKIAYLKLQEMGIAEDPQALMKYLEQHPQYKTTVKRLA